jgi:quercetin dioxygenase-like cupin family protein
MTPVLHPVSGAVLSFSLADEMAVVRRELGDADARVGRTLVKDGPLRATLVGVNPGGGLPAHKADGPITVQVLEGEIEFSVNGSTHTLAAGALLALDAGIVHSVSSPRGGMFLLTVVQLERPPKTAQDATA